MGKIAKNQGAAATNGNKNGTTENSEIKGKFVKANRPLLQLNKGM